MSDRTHESMRALLAFAERTADVPAPAPAAQSPHEAPGPRARAAVARVRARRAGLLAVCLAACAGLLALHWTAPPAAHTPVVDAAPPPTAHPALPDPPAHHAAAAPPAIDIARVRRVIAVRRIGHDRRMAALRAGAAMPAAPEAPDPVADMRWVRERHAERLARRHEAAIAANAAAEASALRARLVDVFPHTLAAARVRGPDDRSPVPPPVGPSFPGRPLEL